LLSVGVATLAACTLFATRTVTVKLLPFDNKSELAVVLDLPQGASLEDTEQKLFATAKIVRDLPEVTSIQVYAGTPAPFNFNGLVRHYYSRESSELGELQINLAPRSSGRRASHEVALDLRGRLKGMVLPEGAVLRVVEVPPGPPVLATLLAEIYGPDSTTRRAVVQEVKKIFADVPFIVDVDDSVKQPRPRLRISIDQDRLEFFGVEQRDVYDTIQTLLGGVPVGLLPPRRGAQSHRDFSTSAEARSRLERTPRLDAGAGQYAAGQPDVARRRYSAATAVSPTWSWRILPASTRRRSTACWRSPTASTPTIGVLFPSQSSVSTASPRTNRGRRCCGMANGRSPTSHSATWAPRSARQLSESTFCWSRSSAASGCRW
jgi:hypothetical protein